MMKNSEWGASAYLSHSKYGANREIYINNSQSYYTGRSGGNVGGKTPLNKTYTAGTSKTQSNIYENYTWDGYLFNYVTKTKSSTRDLTKVASTTENITGIYDMPAAATVSTLFLLMLEYKYNFNYKLDYVKKVKLF